MYDKEIVKSSLLKIEDALNRIIERSQSIHAVNDLSFASCMRFRITSPLNIVL